MGKPIETIIVGNDKLGTLSRDQPRRVVLLLDSYPEPDSVTFCHTSFDGIETVEFLTPEARGEVDFGVVKEYFRSRVAKIIYNLVKTGRT